MPDAVSPFPKNFPEKLASYCEQINEAIRGNKHHDTRRHLFLNFLREAFKIDPVDVELESKITAGELRGRIDALYRHIIVEVKRDFDGERDDAQHSFTGR
jgi:hypothetical protein